MCPGSTADPGNAEANADDAAGSAEAIKVSYCRRSEGRFGCAWFRFRRCGSCSVQRAACHMCNCPSSEAQPAVGCQITLERSVDLFSFTFLL